MLTTLAISLIGVLTLRTGVDLLLDIALALASSASSPRLRWPATHSPGNRVRVVECT